MVLEVKDRIEWRDFFQGREACSRNEPSPGVGQGSSEEQLCKGPQMIPKVGAIGSRGRKGVHGDEWRSRL